MVQKDAVRLLSASCAFLIFGAFGCANKYVRNTTPADSAPTTAAADSDSSGEPSMRNMVLHSVSEVKVVHFDYDSAMIGPDARSVLTENAAWLKTHDGIRIQVAGYCDQRGTEAYNLALGQRRAQAVRKYYSMLGVDANSVATISYGKEKPACDEMNEGCWHQNRRAETLIAYPETVGSAK